MVLRAVSANSSTSRLGTNRAYPSSIPITFARSSGPNQIYVTIIHLARALTEHWKSKNCCEMVFSL
eukprot:scaffold2459_cov225-Ochromonas_danica.AAC.1